MKKTVTLLLLAAVTLFAVSCNKTSTKSAAIGDYMIVGHAGGFVAINSPYFLLTGTGLSEDTMQYPYAQVPADLSGFHFTYRLPAARYDTVKAVLTSIPGELLGKSGQDIGLICPDYGYDDVRASINGIVYKWKFECDQSASSAEVQAFVNKVRADFY